MANLVTPFSVWDFTAVTYETDSLPSLLLGMASLLPVCFVVALLASLATSPRPSALRFLWVLFLSDLLNAALKQVIQHPRPPPLFDTPLLSTGGFGMPSRHAQFMAALATWFLVRREPAAARTQKASASERGGGLVGGCLFPFSWHRQLFLVVLLPLVCWSRIAGGHHTVTQVMAGASVGFVLALFLAATRIPAFLTTFTFPVALWVHRCL